MQFSHGTQNMFMMERRNQEEKNLQCSNIVKVLLSLVKCEQKYKKKQQTS